ncbi:hypothetical protein [Elizabethkingia ursingii]|uniref:Uncharacterized protein n=1 Tax=Elizabethkingia ursingii TaxID=1756150 RepID=A0ABX3NCW9_9FLAO|nr:hypothetical protein [Elizabethkingia ursingii]OPB94382.1 hypothetical protein BB021_17385 [Elizabethkingia ursingii]
MNINNQSQEFPVKAKDNNTSTENGLPVEGVFQVGTSKVGYSYIYEDKDPNPPSDSNLIFQYDEARNQILQEMLSQ